MVTAMKNVIKKLSPKTPKNRLISVFINFFRFSNYPIF
jgi:hypothetical protein